MERQQRRLTAIISADVVGYSRLMETDETGTLATLKRHREELIDPKVKQYGGRVVGTAGDGQLVEFPSVVDAVQCAVEVQQGMDDRNAKVPSELRMDFRVGVNLGDIIVDGEDIHGDGVNVAARLQQLAAPGGLCIAGTVREHIAGKLPYAFEDAGEQQVKNIARPVRVFRLRPNRQNDAPSAANETSKLALPSKPSVAVLPFTNMSGDAEQEYFADGITEDIITELSRFRSLFVIARNSSFAYKGRAANVGDVGRELGVAYVVEGSVRKASNRVRVTAQLVEAQTGNHVWAERYDRGLQDIFAVQDEVTQAIASVLPARLHDVAFEQSRRKPSENLSAYEHVLHARWLLSRNLDDRAPVIEELERAIELDPGFAQAHAWLAKVHADSVFSKGEAAEERVELARRHAERALAADDKDAFVHANVALACIACGDHARGKTHADKALALNPNDFQAIFARGCVLCYSGQPMEALDWFGKAMRLDPHAPDSFLEMIVECHYMLRAFHRAIEVFNGWQNPPFYMYSVLAVCHAQLGDDEAAGRAIKTYHAGRPASYDPQVSMAAHLRMCARPEDRELWLEGYRKVGF